MGYNTPMRVVFLEDVPHVGKMGEVKEVASGYGRNFLLPRRLALLATPSALKILELKLQKERIRQQQLNAELNKLAQQLEGFSIAFKAKVVEEERLYGSIRDSDIAAEISQCAGFDIDKKKIELEEPIHQLGSYEITVRLAKDLAPKIKVVITAEE